MGLISDLITNVTAFRATTGDKLNSLYDDIGNKSMLNTNNKTSLVSAINEINSSVLFSDDARIAKWDEAYGWGDFRQFGLGTDIPPSHNTSNTSNLKKGIYRFTSGPGLGAYGTIFHGGWNAQNYQDLLITDNHKAFISTRNNTTSSISELATNNRVVHLARNLDDIFEVNGGTSIAGINLDNVYGNKYFYTQNNTTGSNNYYHHLVFGIADIAFQIRKAPTHNGGLAIRTVYKPDNYVSNWEEIAYLSRVNSDFVKKKGDDMSGFLAAPSFSSKGVFTSRITTIGWKRIARGIITGGGGCNMKVIISRNYNTNNNESYTFSISCAYNGKTSITQISGTSNQRVVTAIRVVNTISGGIDVDMYYNTNNNNDFYITVEGNGKPLNIIDAPSETVGVTEIATTDGITTTDGIRAIGLSGSGTRMVIANQLGNLSTQPLPINTTYSAGNGLTSSETVFSLGTPSAITATSTNSTTATSHTHALTSLTVAFNTDGLPSYVTGPVSGVTDGPYGNNSVMGNWTTLASSITYGAGFFARNNKAWFLTKEAGVLQPWNEIYHTGNLTISNYYTKTEANNQFVNLTAVQTIGGTKTFSLSPIVPNASLANHALNKGQMETWVNAQGFVKTDTTYSEISIENINSTTSSTVGLITGRRINALATTKGWDAFELTTQGGLRVRNWDTVANKPGAISIGQGATATKINALAMMNGANADGTSSIACGPNAQALKARSMSFGPNSTNNAPDSGIFGVGLLNNQRGAFIVGNYNLPILNESTNEVTANSPLFIVGNGKDSMFRSNSMVHYQDGSTNWNGRQYYNSATRQESWFDEDNTLVDVKYLRENGGGGGGSGLPHEPEIIPNTDWAYVGDTIYGVINSKDIGIVVCLAQSGLWEVVHGTNVGALKYGLMYGFVVKPNSILIRGYVRDKTLNSTARGRALRVNGSTAVTVSLVPPSSVAREDVKLGTVISTTGIIYFNPEN